MDAVLNNVQNRVNLMSEKSGLLIVNGLVIIGVFGFLLMHPSASSQMVPIVAVIVGHYFGRSKAE